MDVETAAGTSGTSRVNQILAVLVGITALAAALLAVLQTDSSRREERGLLLANRLAVQAFEKISARGVLSSFSLRSLQDAVALGIEGTGRALATFDLPSTSQGERALANAKIGASDRLLAIAQAMGAEPRLSGPLDAHATEVLRSTDDQLNRLVAEQNRQVDVAQRFGERGSRAVFALTLLAVAAVLLGLAAVLQQGRPTTVAMVAAAGLLLVALGWGGSALLV
jgi:hypothetical protein